MNVCYGCRYLVQSLGANACVRFDHDGPQQGTMLRDDPPEPLYEDCYSTEACGTDKCRIPFKEQAHA